jgi:membrane peptidoglycan carboxypeptidase
MANLSSAAVATLVSDIGNLRKAFLAGTLVDQAQIAKRHDVATNGLLTPNATPGTTGAIRVISETAALKLQVAIRAVVERGTAKSVAPILADTGWQIGSKTGSGPVTEPLSGTPKRQ